MLVGSRKEYWEAMHRNQWYVPSLKVSLLTIDYMHKVREKKLWAPRYKDVRLAPCPRPPTNAAIFKAAIHVSRSRGHNLGIKLGGPDGKGARLPDRRWALNVLSTLAPGHEFFKKSYRPPPIRDGRVVYEDEISDNDDFFEDLPEQMDKKVRKRMKIFNVPKTVQYQRKVHRYQAQIDRIRG